MSRPVVLAITGASGSIYGIRLLHVLMKQERETHLVISPAAGQVLERELGVTLASGKPDVETLLRSGASVFPELNRELPSQCKVFAHDYRDYSAGIASGSFRTAGMAICPCSMGTLSSIAQGISGNLIHRAADVHLKERRKLIVVPRETPLGSIQLANMKTLSDAGAVILPAMPGFYHLPQSIADLVDFVVARICDQLEIDVTLASRWGEDDQFQRR